MAFQVHRKRVQCLSTILVHISLLLSCFHLKSCMCSGTSNHKDQLGNLTLSYVFDQVPGHLFLSGSRSCNQDASTVWGGLGSYMNAYYPEFDLSQTGWFFPLFSMDQLDWTFSTDGASFSVAFSMSIYQPNHQAKANGSMLFALLPDLYIDTGETYEDVNHVMFDEYEDSFEDIRPGDHFPFLQSNATSGNVAGSLVFSNITVDSRKYVIRVRVAIEQPGNSSVDNKYSVWIDYHHVKQQILVYVGAGEGATAKPANHMTSMILNKKMFQFQQVSFGFFSSMGQLLQLRTWNSTVQRLPLYCDPSSQSANDNEPDPYGHQSPQAQGSLAIILSSVVGSAAATAITAAVVYLYFTSKYRKWKKEHGKLAKTMRCLPGVPSQIDYADVKKATKSFHETTKLGKGGFGAVYRCTLPVAASRTGGQSVDVAVKKFMRELEDRRYDDFLAEVSIINRLRHKNIVPLIGWSYNKGEPILIYEYMMNGSLDQHLFLKDGAKQRRHQQEDTSVVGRWQTRYSIAKDIATGLHYVHHEHEPMVLHRDIKASNILLDSTFHARLGDFGIASTVAVDRSSVTGIAGTWGYIAPEYAMTYKSTRQTDTYAFGVLILEVVTGKKNSDVPPDDDHITDWVWRLHQEGKLLEAVDGSVVLTASEDDHKDDCTEEARRLLLLGLACTNPNPFNRPSMAEVVQVITKLAPPPDVPLERPTFMWPPEDWRYRNSVYSTAVSDCHASSASTVELAQVIQEQVPSAAASAGEHASVDSRVVSGELASAN